MSKPIVIHHLDHDGYGAALAAFAKFGLEAEYIAVDWGQPMPEIPSGAEVYILDFSYPREELVALSERVDKLVVVEHHETAAKVLKGLDFVIHEPKRAACIAAWKYFYPEAEIPGLLLRIEDRDLWKFDHDDTKPVYAYLLTAGSDIARWDDLRALYEQSPAAIVEPGKALNEFMYAASMVLAAEAGPMAIGKKVVVAANVALCWLQSQVADTLLKKHPDVAFVAVWRQRGDGSTVFNLRSLPGKANVAKVAETFGGGGHKQAAGFILPAPKEVRRILPPAKEVALVAEPVEPEIVEESATDPALCPLCITSHQAPGVQRDCTILAKDPPGPSGASHDYLIEWFNVRPGEPTETDSVDLRFHRPADRGGQNGLFMEDLLAVIEHRLAGYQRGPNPCAENELALGGVGGALDALHSRTQRICEETADQED